LLLRFQATEDKKQDNNRRGLVYLGKVKTERIKRIGKELMERFPDKFSSNFDDNKREVEALTQGTTTRVRNQIAGYITRVLSIAQADSPNKNPEETEA
jgi:small subunit ribosomal protein S17e